MAPIRIEVGETGFKPESCTVTTTDSVLFVKTGSGFSGVQVLGRPTPSGTEGADELFGTPIVPFSQGTASDPQPVKSTALLGTNYEIITVPISQEKGKGKGKRNPTGRGTIVVVGGDTTVKPI